MSDAVYDSVFDSLKRAIVHTSTFSENGLAMRAGLATLDVLEGESLGARATAAGEALRARLTSALGAYPMVKDVRGLGLLSGIEFTAPKQLSLRIPFEAFRAIHPGKGMIWLEGRSIPQQQEDGSILWHGIILDTTERKQSEEKLQELVDELKKSQQMAHVGNWKLDLKTGAYSSSDEALRIFGFPLGSFLKIQNISDCIHPDDVERVSNRRDELLQSKERYSIEFRIINKETGQVKNIKSIGEVQCDEENNPIAIIGTLQDITDNKLVLEALKKG